MDYKIKVVIFMLILIIGDILLLIFGNDFKRYNCDDPRDKCSGYQQARTSNCFINESFLCESKNCTLGCLEFLDYEQNIICREESCDADLLGPGGIVMVVFGVLFLVIGLIGIAFSIKCH